MAPVPPPPARPEILRRIEQIAAEVVRPRAAEVDQQARWPEESLRRLQQAGLAGLNVPQDCGGLGEGLLALVQACEVLGRECASTALCFGMHCVGTAVLAAKATPDQQKRYLEPIARGEHLTTLALSEPGTGVHFYFPQTELVADANGDYRVSGTKMFVTNGGRADSYVVSCAAVNPDAVSRDLSCVVLARDADGVVWGSPWDGLGMRGNSSVAMKLHDVGMPRRDLLGEPGDQIWFVLNVITPFFLAAMTGTYLGIASTAFAEARDHLQTRSYTHGGPAPANSQLVQHRLGSVWASLERTRQLAYHAATVGDAGGDDVLQLLFAAKAEVADCAVEVVNEAMTLTGGISYRGGARLERCLRDARAAPVMAPTTDILRIWTGRALLGLPILGE